MSEAKSDPVILPRPFKLRIEANAAAGKKAQTYLKGEHSQFISYGLVEPTAKQKADPGYDIMGYWQGMLIGIQNKPCGEVMYSWVCKMPRNYPDSPPLIRFCTKISLPFVDNRGFVNVGAIPGFKWKPELNLADVLMAIRECMREKTSCDASYRLIGQEFISVPSASEIESVFQ